MQMKGVERKGKEWLYQPKIVYQLKTQWWGLHEEATNTTDTFPHRSVRYDGDHQGFTPTTGENVFS